MTDIDWSEIDRIKEAYSTRGAHTTSVCLRAIEALKEQVAELEKESAANLDSLVDAAEQARREGALEERAACAELADDAEWLWPIEKWMHATKKEISAWSCREVAMLIRARSEADHG